MEELSGKRQPKASARVLAMLGALLFLMMFLPVAPTAAAETSQNQTTTMVFIIDNSSYTVNGELIVMDVSPVVIEGRTMLPVRYAAAPLGADISWDDAGKEGNGLLRKHQNRIMDWAKQCIDKWEDCFD